MPSFSDEIETVAQPEDVWKLLYDPQRLPEWWVGIEPAAPSGGPDRDYTMYPTGYPGFPMPQRMHTDETDHRVVVSCQFSDLEFSWSLVPLTNGTRIAVEVMIPENEAARLDAQRAGITRSLRRLADAAAQTSN